MNSFGGGGGEASQDGRRAARRPPGGRDRSGGVGRGMTASRARAPAGARRKLRPPALAAAAAAVALAVLACASAAVLLSAAPAAHAAGGEAIAVAAGFENTIRIYYPPGTIVDSFGATGTGAGQFMRPRAIDFHPYGIIAVADQSNHNVQVFYPNGTYAFKIGSGGGCADEQFNTPRGVAIGTDGTIAVGAYSCHSVQVFHPNGTFAFRIGTTGTGSADGELSGPRGVDIASDGTIAVADSGNDRVQVFHPNGTFKSKFGTAGTGNGQFQDPSDVAFLADGGFAVSDRARHNVQRFGPDGDYAGPIGLGRGTNNGQFETPDSVAAGPGGKIAVADCTNNRIQVFNSGGTYQRKFGASGCPQGVAYGPTDAHNATVRVAGVSSPDGPGGYRQGSAIDITVRFTGNVEVATEPALALSTWPPRNATYAGGNGTDALRFVYTVQPGDSAADLDYTGMASLLLDGGDGAGAIRPAAGAAGAASPVLPHPGTPGSLGSPGGIRIVPHASVANVSTPAANATYGAGQNITILVDFGEDVIVTGAPELLLSTDPPAAAGYAGPVGSPVPRLEFTYMVGRGEMAALLAYGGTDALSLAGGPGTTITDVAMHPASLALPVPGAPGSLSHSSRIAIDGSEPEVRRPAGSGPPAPVILTPPASVSNVTLVIEGTAVPGRAVSVFNNGAEVAVTVADFPSGYWRTVFGLAEGRNEITARATTTDGVSTHSRAVTVILDTTPPAVPTVLNMDGEAAPSRMHVIRGTAEPGALVEVFVNGTLGGSSVAHWRTGMWHMLALLEPGDNSVAARAVDGLGNPSGASAVRIVGPDTPVPSQTTPGNPVHVAGIMDRQDEVLLVAPHGVRAFESGGRAYAMVAAGGSSAVQIVDFTDPRAPRIAMTIPNADGRNLAFPRDIEIFTSDQGTTAVVTSVYSHGVELIDIDDPLNPNLAITGSASYRDTDEGGSSRFPQLLGARDAAVFGATVNGTTGTYLVVVSDFGSTSIGPGGFQIVNVTHAAAPTPVYSNHRMVANGTGSYAMSRPPSETPLGPGSNPSTWTNAVADPRIVAVFDGDGDPVAETDPVELPGYGRTFSVPVEGLYTADWGPDPRWSISLNTVIETRNSTGHTISAARDGMPFEFPEDGTCTRADPCTGQYRLIVLSTNDTLDQADDYIIEVYRNDILGTYSYPVAKLIGGKMLSVGLDGEPFRLMGLDADGNRFEVLEGAAAVETFESGGSTYAVVAARDDDGVQIIDLTDPTSPRAVAAVRDGDADGASGTFDELDGAAGVGIATIGGGTYAVVAARDDDGVQIIDVTDPAAPRAASSIADEQGASRNKFSMLDGAIGVRIFGQGGSTYAIVSAEEDNGFQVINITDPERPRAADRGHDGSMCSTAARYNTLGGAIASDTLAFGGRLYAVVAANFDYGVQVVDITDPYRLVVLGAVTDDPGGFTELHEPIAAESVEIGGATYVLVASYKGLGTTRVGGVPPYGETGGGGVQIIEVSDPANPRAAAAIRHNDAPPFDLLHGPRGIDTFVVGSRTYAIVTAESTPGHSDSDGKGSFLIVDITRPERPLFVSGMRDGQPDGSGGRFDMLNAPAGVGTARIGERTYAVIAARGPWLPTDGHVYNGPHGVQIVDVSDPRRPLAVASIRDGGMDASGGTFDTLERAHGVDIARVGPGWYALVTSIRDDGVQVINITDPSSPRATASITGADPRQLDGANAIKAFERSGGTYAIVTAKLGNSLQVINISDPASPSVVDHVTDGVVRDGKGFTELNHVYGVDTFTHDGRPYAITACEENENLDPTIRGTAANKQQFVKDQVCSGLHVIDLSVPTRIVSVGEMYNLFDERELLGARGVAAFTAGGSTYAAVAGFQDDGVEVVRLASGSDTLDPGVVRADLNQERGILRITFSEPVKTSSDVYLERIAIRNATGSLSSVQLTGASLSGTAGGSVVEVALTGAQRRGAAAFASPLLDFTAAAAFEDLSGNDLPARTGVAAEVVTSRPELLGASLDLGTGDIALVFTEAVNSSGLDLSKIAVYWPGDPQVRYSPSEAFTEDGNAEIGIWLGDAARQAVVGLAGAPVLDILDGAVGSSASGRPSVEQRGVVFMPLLKDRVDPALLSALLDGGNLMLEFSEHVNVGADAFNLDQMYVCDGFYAEDGATCEGAANEFSLDGSSVSTTANGTRVIVRLNATQASDAGSYARPVLELRLDGPYSAVQDVSGQGIGAVAAAVEEPTSVPAGGFFARAVSPSTIRVSFGVPVSANATDPGTTWVLGGPDAGGLAVAGYDGMRGAPSVVLTLSGSLPGTRPDLTLGYRPVVGDIAGPDGAKIAGATVSVSDGIPPVVVRAVVDDPDIDDPAIREESNNRAVVVTYSEPVWAGGGAYKNATISYPRSGGSVGFATHDIAGFVGNGSDRHVVAYIAASAPFLDSTGHLLADPAAIRDEGGNALGAAGELRRIDAGDGQGPLINSKVLVLDNSVIVKYSDPTIALGPAYVRVELDPGGAREIRDVGGNGTDRHTVTFDGDAPAPGANAWLVVNDTRLIDDAMNPRGDAKSTREGVVNALPYLTAPASAEITGPDNVTIRFAAPVEFPGDDTLLGSAPSALSVDGGNDRDIMSPGHPLPDTWTFAFGGDPAPPNATGWIAFNWTARLGGGSTNITLADGQDPGIASAEITGPDSATIRYTEPVSHSGAYSAVALRPGGVEQNVDSATGSLPAVEHEISFATGPPGTDAAPNATGTISIAAGSVSDAAGNALGTGQLTWNLTDGQHPYVVSARIADGPYATIRYSEPVSAPHAAYVNVGIGGEDPPSRPSAVDSGNGTETHVITLGGGHVAAANATGTVVIDAALAVDAAGNGLDGPAQIFQALEDGRPPAVLWARITAGNTLSVNYTEPVSAPLAAYAVGINNTVRAATALGGNGTALHEVEFEGTAVHPGTGAGNVTIDGRLVLDLAEPPRNRLGTGGPQTEATADDRPVVVTSASVAGPGVVAVLYEDHGAAPQRFQGLSIDGIGRTATPQPASGGRVEVRFMPADVRPDSAGWIIIDGVNRTVLDGQAPSIAGATAISPDTIRVAFDEPVVAPDDFGDGGWTISGGDSSGRAVSSRTGIERASTELDLALSGELASDSPQGVELRYEAGAPIRDAAGNALPDTPAGEAGVLVRDGIAPRILPGMARITGASEATVRYGERVLAGPGAYTSVSVDGTADPAPASLLRGNGTATHVVSLGGGRIAATNATGTLELVAARLVDGAGNDLGAVQSIVLGDGRPPEVVSANVTAGNTLAVGYSEPVSAPRSAYSGIVVDGDARSADALQGSGTDRHDITFSGSAAVPGSATGRVGINGTLVLDLAPEPANPLGGGLREVGVPYGHVPEIDSARITGSGTVEIRYSKPVSAPQSAYDMLVIGAPPSRAIAAPFEGNGSRTHVLSFTPADAPPNATGTIRIDGATVLDRTGEALGVTAEGWDLADGQYPVVENATAVALDEILVVFSEPVNATGIAGAGGWRVDGGDASGLGVDSVSDISAGAGELTLALDGSFSTTGPAGVELSYDGSAGTITDAGGNALALPSPEAVLDGISPELVRAAVVDPDRVVVEYSEPVEARIGAYVGALLSTPARISDPIHNFTLRQLNDTHTLRLQNLGAASYTGTDGELTVDERYIADAAGNALGMERRRAYHDIEDGQRPELISAAVRNVTSLLVRYSEPVSAPRSAYSDLSLGDATARAFTGVEGNRTANHVAVFADGPAAPADSMGSVRIDETVVFDLADPPNGLGADDNRTIALGDDTRMPEVLSARITGNDTITVVYSRAVTASPAAYTNITVDGAARDQGTTLAGGGGSATHVITFAPAGARANANGTMMVNETAVVSMGGGSLGTGPDLATWNLADGQKPSIEGAAAVSRTTILVRFDEPVTDPDRGAGTGADGWSVRGGEAGAAGLVVQSRTNIADDPSQELVLTLDGELPDDSPSGIVLSYARAGGGPVADLADNELDPVQSLGVADGIRPSVRSANLTGDMDVVVTYSEPVRAPREAYASVSLAGGNVFGIARAVDNGTAVHTITLDGTAVAVPRGSAGNVTINASAVLDNADPPNRLGRAVVDVELDDGRPVYVESSRVTGPGSLTVRFNAAAVPFGYGALSVDGTTRSIEGYRGNGTAEHVILFGGDDAPPNATGWFVIDPLGSLVGRSMNLTLADGQRPAVESARVTAGNTITITYSEPVARALPAYSNLELSPGGSRMPTGLSGTAIGQSHSITFRGDPAATNATGTIDMNGTALADAAGNALWTGTTTQALADGQRPTVDRAAVTGANNLTVRYSEAVDALAGAYSDLVIGTGSPPVTGIAGNTTATHVVSFGGDPAPVGVTGSIALNRSAVLDRASPEPNRMGIGTVRLDLGDDRAPSIVSAEVTGPGNATITYSREVTAQLADYQTSIWIAGKERTAEGLAGGNASDTHVILFAGADAPPNATGSIIINATNVRDGNNATLGTGALNVTLSDGQAPSVRSAAAVSPNEIRVAFDEPVAAADTDGAGWSVSGGDAAGLAVSRTSAVLGEQAELALFLDGRLPDTAPDGVELSYDSSLGTVADPAGNALGDSARVGVADGMAPSVQNATAVSPGEIRVVFGEPVAALNADGGAAAGWSVSGGDAAGLAVSRTSDISGGSVNLALFLDGRLPDTAPDGVELSYDSSLGTVADPAGNALGDSASINVADGIAPRIDRARVSGPANATVSYTEPVAAVSTSAYAGILLAGDADAGIAVRNATLLGPTNGTAEHALAFDGATEAAPNATGTLALDRTLLVDAAGNALGSNKTSEQALADGQRPRIESALITGPNAVTITYAEPVGAPAPAYSNLTLDPGGARNITAVDGGSGDGTAAHTVVFDGGAAPPGAGGNITINATAVLDAADPPNALGAARALEWPISDGRTFSIIDSGITGPNTAAIRYSRPASAQLSAYTQLVVDGQARSIGSLNGGTNATNEVVHTLTFSGGDPVAASATGLVAINASAIADLKNNATLGAGTLNRTLADGQAPSVQNATAVSPGEIRVAFDEPVGASDADGAAAAAGWSVSGGDAAGLAVSRTSAVSGEPAELALLLDGRLPDTAPDNVELSYDFDTGAVADPAGNALGGFAGVGVADGIAPRIDRARVSGPANATVSYTEPVAAVSPSAYAGISLAGDADAGIAARNATLLGPTNGTAEHALAFNGSGAAGAAAAANATGTLALDRTLLVDAAGNALGSNKTSEQALADGQRPRIESALITGPNAVTITYAEPVGAPAPAYSNLTLDPGGARNITAVDGGSGDGTAAHTVVFDGGAAPPGAGGNITINATAVLDAADPPNALGAARALEWPISDGRGPATEPPGEARIVRSAFTARNTVTITYSGGLDVPPGGNASAAYGAITIEPAAGSGAGNATTAMPENVTGWGTATHTIVFGGAGVGAGQNGTIELAADLEGRDGASGGPIRLARGLIPIAAGETVRTIELPPAPGPGEPPGRDPAPPPAPITHDGFTRAVNGTAAGEAARPAINVTGLAAGNGTVSFPRDGNVTLATSFARVTFPPNATALSAPDGGLLALHVSAKPAREQVAAALGHGNATNISIRTVVEVGDNRTDIAFDTPVRILLVGQGGGRAFYVNSTGGGGVSPIDTECGADGAAAARAQLGGAGECQLDSGPDKVIHTHHLTRFGTAVAHDEPGDGQPAAAASASVLQRAGGDPLRATASYTAGETIVVGIAFTEPVAVDASGGAPYLELRTGSAGARAAYSAGSGTETLEFSYVVRGGDIAARLSYAGAGALSLNGGAIAAASGSGAPASIGLPPPGEPGSLSHAAHPPVRIDPEPGRPVLDVGILDDDDDEAGSDGRIREAALASASAFNERQGRTDGALLLNATAYDAEGTAAAALLQAAHADGAGPSVYVGPSTDRGLHAAMPYAAASGIVLVSAGSTAPSLAVEDDTVFRLLPGGRIDAEALARLARAAEAQSTVAVLENATHGPPTAAGAGLTDATPPPQDRFSRAFDAALAYAGVPTLSGTITLEGAAAGGPYAAAAAAEALDAAVQAARSSQVAVVYAGSPDGLAALAEASASHPDLASATWIASGLSANSSLLAGDGPAAAFAAQSGLQAVRWSVPANDLARAVDSLLPPGADAAARHRAYAAYDAMGVVGEAAALAAADTRGDTPDAAAVAELFPGTAAAYDGALGDIALDHAGDLWVPAVYDLWTVGTQPGGTAAEWTLRQGALDETRACSITLTRAKIDYGPIDSGQTSRPHLQTIVNTGQLPFSRVDLTATPWHVDSPGNCEPGGTPSLPVGLSEIRTVQGGAFSDLAGSGTVLAQGLEAGSRSPLWYRLSLAGYADLPQAEITQCATYVVRCG